MIQGMHQGTETGIGIGIGKGKGKGIGISVGTETKTGTETGTETGSATDKGTETALPPLTRPAGVSVTTASSKGTLATDPENDIPISAMGSTRLPFGGRAPRHPFPLGMMRPRSQVSAILNSSIGQHQHCAASGKSSPAPAPSKPSKAPPANDPVDAHVKRVTELVCERVFWYMQRDSADKKSKRLQSDADRCNAINSDFSSAFEMIKLQRNQAEEDRNKCCSRVEAADEKLRAAVQLLMSKLSRSMVDETAKPKSDGEAKEKPALDIESRLLALQRSIETAAAKTLAETAFATKKTFQTQLESETALRTAQNAELRAQLAMEKSRNDQLETKLDELGRKFDAMSDASKRADQQESARADQAERINPPSTDNSALGGARAQAGQMAKLTAEIQEATKSLVTRDELEKALQVFDNKMSSDAEGPGDGQQSYLGAEPGDKTRLKLLAIIKATGRLESSVRVHDQHVTRLALCIQNVQQKMDAHESSTNKQAGQQMEARSTMKTLEESVAKLAADNSSEVFEKRVKQIWKPSQRDQRSLPVAGTATGSISDEHILKVTWPQVDKRVHEITQKLGAFLDNERTKRESVDTLAQQTASTTSLVHNDLNELKTEYTKSIKELGNQALDQTAELKLQGQKIATLESALPAVRNEAKNYHEDLAQRVCTLSTWQDNFNTRPLYKDIVEYIKATVPTSVLQQLNHLNSRVTSVEVQLGVSDGGAMKRRKLQHSTPGAANGLQ